MADELEREGEVGGRRDEIPNKKTDIRLISIVREKR